MAHTNRDDERIARRNHHRDQCPNRRRTGRHGDWTKKPCLFCHKEPAPRYWCSTEGKPMWNRDQRQAERGNAKYLIRRTFKGHHDWDDLTITYHRPYWD